MLAGVANAALESNEIHKAERYAKELLIITPKYMDDPYYGTAIHLSNIILGRIAIIRKDIKKAKELLLKAGASPRSQRINMFGPNMSLAVELLKLKERKTVIEYLEACKKFWKEKKINEWIKDIKAGEIPEQMEFMAQNTYY